jgi:dTDP-glucose 4,6-dehydratase
MARKSQNNLFDLPARDLTHILRNAAAELEALRGKSIFITGGTGFFGKWLLGGLCHADAELGLGLRLTALSRDPASFLRRHPEAADVPGLHFEQGHVADFPLGDDRDHHLDFIIHAATDTTAFTSDADEQKRSHTILEGTRHMLDFARESSAQRFLNISSGAVYGAFAGQLTGAKEDDYASAQPLTPYGEAKRNAERLCAESGVDFVTARAFAFLGPYLPLDAHFAAGNFLRDALRGGPILVRGDGTALRSYLYPADLVVWLLRILLRGQRACAYNVGSDEAITTAQLARLIAAAVQPNPEVVIQSVQPQGPQNIYLPDIARARTELNLDVAIPLQDAIARTLEFLEVRRQTCLPS